MTAQDAIGLYSLLTQNDIDVWLDGGWGVDALLGEQTRPHKDMDIVIQKKDVPALRKLLGKQDYQEIKLEIARPHNFVLADKQGREVDVHVVVFDELGNGIYGPAEKGVMYPSYCFAGKGKINGHEVNCLTAEYQVESHSGYAIKEKDIADVTALCRKFSIDLPKEYRKNNPSRFCYTKLNNFSSKTCVLQSILFCIDFMSCRTLQFT